VSNTRFFATTQTFTVAAVKNFFTGKKHRSEFTLSNVRQDIEQYLADLLNRLNALEEKEKGTSDLKTRMKKFTDTLTFEDDPPNNLSILKRDITKTNTWYFGKPHLFSEPIKFGGGSGPWSANQVSNASD